MLRELRIKNFRALSQFAMSGLGRVNLLVGTNNCGKTSVLEAIDILSWPGNPLPSWQAQLRRGEFVETASDRQLDVAHLIHGHELREGAVHDHARESTRRAGELGAPFRDDHRGKAELHAWLAWQDPPGQQLHAAVRARTLPPTPPVTGPFVVWFRQLFEL
jgi:hypothetical protein